MVKCDQPFLIFIIYRQRKLSVVLILQSKRKINNYMDDETVKRKNKNQSSIKYELFYLIVFSTVLISLFGHLKEKGLYF